MNPFERALEKYRKLNVYPAKYTDKNGEVETTIRNDWRILRMNARGVEFSGTDFDFFEPGGDSSKEELSSFSLTGSGELCDCAIFCEIPVKVLAERQEITAALSMKLDLGKVNEKGWIDKEDLFLTLKYRDFEFRSKGGSGLFEDELVDIQRQLPETHKLKCCFGCAFSDYKVYGHGLFGDMLCFRNIKEKYLKASGKYEFMEIMNEFEQQVQEIYLCPEFEIRKPGTGYRG